VGIIADAKGVGTIALLFVGLAILLLVVYDLLERIAPVEPRAVIPAHKRV
jgi:hypothetical protein